MEDTWTTRDLPVLDAIVWYLEEHDEIDAMSVAETTELALEDVLRACRALEGTYIRKSTMPEDSSDEYYVDTLTELRQQLVGLQGSGLRVTNWSSSWSSH